MLSKLREINDSCYQEFEGAFVTSADKREALTNREESLAAVVAPEDLAVLRQRLRLLSKQWEEIRQQVVHRQQRINDRLAQWTQFSEHYNAMLDWVSAIETKTNSGHEFHLEELLSKLQNVSHHII